MTKGALKDEPYNVFVVGLDHFHLAQLQALPEAHTCRFHALFTRETLKCAERFPVERLVAEGTAHLQSFPGQVDAVVGYWDFPVSTTLPLLRRVVDLPGPTLESVLKCEHKYWSRREQAQVVPEHTPDFCVVDPYAAEPLADITVDYPFWIKPVKAVLSYLAFHIRDEADFQYAIQRIRGNIERFGEPFNYILRFAALPPEIATIDGNHCIVEADVAAQHQCTLEGYACSGDVKVYGVVDSLRKGPAASSFARYQYPSALPATVQARMADSAARVIRQIGYETAPFNAEFFWDEESDQIWLLEINPRLSKSHAPLFQMVDGCYHHQVMVSLGLGWEPRMPHRKGKYDCAAKFMVRRWEDARVVRVPTREEIEALENAIPGVIIEIEVSKHMRLAQLRYQDAYSFEIATIFVGADSTAELVHKYHEVMARLPLELA